MRVVPLPMAPDCLPGASRGGGAAGGGFRGASAAAAGQSDQLLQVLSSSAAGPGASCEFVGFCFFLFVFFVDGEIWKNIPGLVNQHKKRTGTSPFYSWVNPLFRLGHDGHFQ